MINRRKIIKRLLLFSTIVYAVSMSLGKGIVLAWGRSKRRLVEKGTPMSELMHADPAELDTRKLETTPIDAFDVMGETTYRVKLEEWRLEVNGAVRHPGLFKYEELLERPVLERNALLICPGFFAYNGLWRGFSVADLLKDLGLDPDAAYVRFYGSEGFRKKNQRFKIDEIMSDSIFIAYGVNNIKLPERHGFPLRLVAGDYKGRRWIKYLNKIIVVAD